jgi:hypothetical protein
MNTRGLMELIVLNVSLRSRHLHAKLFTIFVIMAITTTCMTGPLMTRFQCARGRRHLTTGTQAAAL